MVACVVLLVIGFLGLTLYHFSCNSSNDAEGYRQMKVVEKYDTVDININIPFLVGSSSIHLDKVTRQKIDLIVQFVLEGSKHLTFLLIEHKVG